MAEVVVPTKQLVVDDQAGNFYIIAEVHHTTGDDTLLVVPDSAVSCAELPAANGVAPAITQGSTGSNTATVNPASGAMVVQNATSGASGLGFSFVAGDGVKQVIIDTNVATGTYKIVVRCIGSAGGVGAGNSADL